ncbi:hypothetical protein ABW19_dt0206536 [Dactylella cylindrospora]|nr:hypothetical protein ABW19_dt0206536 [Dactylella cylindrospora]
MSGTTPIISQPQVAGILKPSATRPISPSSTAAASQCEKCSIHTKNTQGGTGEIKHSNMAACGEWLSCICGTVYFVICWSCTLSGEVKSHKHPQGRRGSSVDAGRKGSTGSCTCSNNRR